ncbi:MAG: c-type cytochrome [Litoreibacter sp.]|uniref:c-type cytochrome n=1 Tax=Litoreibacter sp. TaxID=1969459 RepID=UPI00329680CC
MKFAAIAAMTTALLAAPAFAEGDAAKGEKTFKKCKSCHTIADGDNVITKGGKTGPNLFGLPSRVIGSTDFKYSKSAAAASELGAEWTEEDFIAWVANPTDFLRTKLDDPKAKSKMSFRLKKADDAADVWAYLVSVSPES